MKTTHFFYCGSKLPKINKANGKDITQMMGMLPFHTRTHAIRSFVHSCLQRLLSKALLLRSPRCLLPLYRTYLFFRFLFCFFPETFKAIERTCLFNFNSINTMLPRATCESHLFQFFFFGGNFAHAHGNGTCCRR